MTTAESWWGDEEHADALAYLALREILAEGLEWVKIYRVGEVKVGVYLVGGCGRDLVGVQTVSVET